MKILISAYACSPYRGSEPGMGWNFVNSISQFNVVHVITEKDEFEKDIKSYLQQNPAVKNIKFHYIRRNHYPILKKIWPPSYYWFYRKWQQRVYKMALKLDEQENFDIFHQLNMVGFREPGFLWKINKPFVWGPIGGTGISPWKFLPKLGMKGLFYYGIRNIINIYQIRYHKRPQKAATHFKNALIAATPETSVTIKKIWGKDSTIMCEVGEEKNRNFVPSKRTNGEPLKIIWSGIHTPGKNLGLLLDTLRTADFPFELHVLGKGEMTKKWIKKAQKLKIHKFCKWYGWLNKEDAINVMKEGHVFCITSILDLTATVTLEALSYGLPIISLDHCGFSHVINEKCGIKIPVDSPQNATLNFNLALKKLNDDEGYRQSLSKGAINRASDFNWESKAKQLNLIYHSLVK